MLLCSTHDMNCQIKNMHIGNFKRALESMELATSNSCCANALGAVLLVTVPLPEAHFIHYTYLFSVIRVMRIPYFNQYICLHTISL